MSLTDLQQKVNDRQVIADISIANVVWSKYIMSWTIRVHHIMLSIRVIILQRDGRYPTAMPKPPQAIEMTPVHTSSDITNRGFPYVNPNLSKYNDAYSLSLCYLQNSAITGQTIFKIPKASWIQPAIAKIFFFFKSIHNQHEL